MSFRYAVLAIAVVAASGCVQERVVHERPVIVERPAPVRYVEVVAPQPPPQEIIEVEPAYRPGFIWARGYWHWDGHRYVAMHGHWEPVRPGYRYVHPHWEQRGDGWHLRAGMWIN